MAEYVSMDFLVPYSANSMELFVGQKYNMHNEFLQFQNDRKIRGRIWLTMTHGGEVMYFRPNQFGTVLKNARMDKRLTQAELAENLDISLSYLKDLERFRNYPSYEVFERVIRYFNLSADAVVYPERDRTDDVYQQLERLLARCSKEQLRVVLATTEALLSAGGSAPGENAAEGSASEKNAAGEA